MSENAHQPPKRARTTETDTLSKILVPVARKNFNEVDDVPSVQSMQTLNAALQKMCGIDTIAYNGALGHYKCVHSYYMSATPKHWTNLRNQRKSKDLKMKKMSTLWMGLFD
ncbi:hypothetical protein B0H14DRAFT_2613754 [Mycena olivaceomarginata]|nr:hypothetical protein B0H14DRAFT_2647939 [Mycena olivaceomarginata]KAJ7803015.1 hypothetical protein B0H14DRAFT_2613754 [Mycena olivaceomarginata]